MTNEDEGLDSIGVGQIQVGVPVPRVGGFMVRLQRELERLAVGDMVTLTSVTFKQERHIRSRMAAIHKGTPMRYTVRVGAGRGKREGKRTLQIWRTE